MKEQHLQVSKTARYYTLGELTDTTKQVWIVLHGFGQRAENFLQNFEPLLSPEVFFVAPEGLNRFYLKGSYGTVGATWMTKDDRLCEIDDYLRYLDRLYQHLQLKRYPQTSVSVLGFSQGAATASRWVGVGTSAIDRLIIYAGEMGRELFPLAADSPLRKTKNYFVYGDADKYFPLPLIEKMKQEYADMHFSEIIFSGGHQVVPDVLKQLL